MTHESYDQRLAKLREAVAIAERVGNTFLRENLMKAIRELQNDYGHSA